MKGRREGLWKRCIIPSSPQLIVSSAALGHQPTNFGAVPAQCTTACARGRQAGRQALGRGGGGGGVVSQACEFHQKSRVLWEGGIPLHVIRERRRARAENVAICIS